MTARALLAAMVLAAPVAARVGWVGSAEGVYERAAAAASDDGGGQDGKGAAESTAQVGKRYRATGHPPRSGTTRVRITAGTGADAGLWVVNTTYVATLRQRDPMVDDLRTGDQILVDWLPFEIGLGRQKSADCSYRAFQAYVGDDILRQSGSGAPVRATALSSDRWQGDAYDCVNGDTVVTLQVRDGRLGAHGVFDRWTVTIDTSDRTIRSLRGAAVLRQSAHSAVLLLPARAARVTVELDGRDYPPTGRPGGAAFVARALQETPGAGWEALWLILAVVAVARYWLVPFVRDWAPEATRRRWVASAVAGSALTGVLLLYSLNEPGDSSPQWSFLTYPGGAALTVWWWVVLPFLVAAFAVRLTEGRAPTPGRLLPLAVPSLLLLIPMTTLAVTGRTAGPLLVLVPAIAVTVAVAWALTAGLCGSAGRRWAGTAAIGTWLAVLAAGPGMGLPITYTYLPFPSWQAADSIGFAGIAWGWAAVVWALLTFLDGRRWVAWSSGAALLGVAVGTAVGVHQGFEWNMYDDVWQTTGPDDYTAASWPLGMIELGIAWAALTYLRRCDAGPGEGGWPRYTRTAMLALGVAAAGSGLGFRGFSPFGWDTRSAYYTALVIAAVGFSWLLPPAAGDRAARLHDARPRVHNRLVHALLKDQALAAGRREFLTASRAGLASGDLSTREWSRRWASLGGLGARGTSPQRSAALRTVALGTSGGRSGLRNGVAGAATLALLTVPWLSYTLPPLLGQVQDIQNVEAWAYCLRWPLYGFVYGYAYSWLRGDGPIGKALCLLAVVLPVELAQLLHQGLEPGRFVVSLLITTGNCLAVLLVLGLYWEARLVRAAGLRWGQIRNFRSLSAVAVPATTVLVAAATTLATTMVGAWITPDTGPAADNRPSVTSSQTPGP
ncbi:hypothetical protein ACYF6T_27275 [Streptomyces sp. 7R007]